MKKCKTLLSCIIITCLLLGCNTTKQNEASIKLHTQIKRTVTKTFFALDTVNSITIMAGGYEELLEESESLVSTYENMFSKTIETSDVYAINHSDGAYTEVSEETIKLLETSIEFARLTDGALDITISPAKELWDFTGDNKAVPPTSSIQEAIRHVDYTSIEIRDQKVRLTDTKSQIDLGCIAKGYIADQVKAFLVDNGVTSAIINLGGNIIVIGEKPDKTPFKIGIQKPFEKMGIYETTVELSDKNKQRTYATAVTSGTYERCFKIDDTLYHHILDPKTGMPAQTDLSSVTILGQNSMTADALSTACIVLGSEKATDLIKSQSDVKAIMILTNGDVLTVEGEAP